MRGGTQSHLMLGDDGNLWVVKFKNNPQHLKILANELIATRMAEALNLSVPVTTVIGVSSWLIQSSPQLSMNHGRQGQEMCASGLQFGSQFAGGLMPRQVVDYLPDYHLQSTRNLGEFAGMLAFDKWTANNDSRQAVFRRTSRERDYRAVFIDQGFCFGAGEWTFRDAPLKGVFARNSVYSGVTGWSSFEPWLTRIEEFSAESLWEIVESVPPEWYGNDQSSLEQLVETLLRRRSLVRELIEQFRHSDRAPFPEWNKKARTCARSRPPVRRRQATHSQCKGDQTAMPPHRGDPLRLNLSFNRSNSDAEATSWKDSGVTSVLAVLPASLDRWLTSHSF